MKKVGLSLITFLIALPLLFTVIGGSVEPAAASPPVYEFKWVSFLPEHQIENRLVKELFMDRLNKRSKGEIVTKWHGGPESMGIWDIPVATKQGAIEIGMTFSGALEPLVKCVAAMMLSEITLDEERQPGGAYDTIEKLFNKGGLHLLGRAAHGTTNFFYSWMVKKKIQTPEELRGLLIGAATAARPAVKVWGGKHVSVDQVQTYSAMERGMVDAMAGQPLTVWIDQSYYEVSKYCVDHAYFKSTATLVMNLAKWNQLPEHLKKLVTDTMVEAEKEIRDRLDAKQNEMRQTLKNKGIEFIKFSPEDAKKYLNMTYEAAWDFQQKRYPNITPKLRALYRK